MHLLNVAILLLASVVLSACGSDQPDAVRTVATVSAASGPGAEHFAKVCANCHEVDGGGKAAVKAPALTNLQPWYIERQLKHFRKGIRGAHPQDVEGGMMAFNAKKLSDELISELAVHIDQLPDASPTATLTGDANLGKDHFQNVCAACHGNNGRGNQALGAPSLVGIDDWYLLHSYEKFRAGIRGKHPDDSYGIQMVRIAPTLEDEDMAANVMTYLATLPVSD